LATVGLSTLVIELTLLIPHDRRIVKLLAESGRFDGADEVGASFQAHMKGFNLHVSPQLVATEKNFTAQIAGVALGRTVMDQHSKRCPVKEARLVQTVPSEVRHWGWCVAPVPD